MSENQDYYKILHISENADLEEIKKSFRRLARDCHPDLHPHDLQAAERFRLLREAYEVLSDSVKRKSYDRRRKKQPSFAQPESVAQVYYVRGVENSIGKNYRAAIASLTEAIRLQPRFVEAYLKRCEAYLAIGEEKAALEDCHQALRNQPDSVIAHYYQGRARQSLGYAESAIQAYTRAIRLDQTFAPSYYYRGVAHHELRYTNRALSDWREYAALCKQQGNVRGYHLAMTAMSQYSWVSFKIYNRTPGQWWGWLQEKNKKPSLNRRPTRSFQPRKIIQQYLTDLLNELKITLITLFGITFQLLRNPAGGLLPAYSSLSPKLAAIAGGWLIVISEMGFLVGMLSRFGASWNAALRWSVLGLIPMLSLFAISFITHFLIQHPRHWSADLFFASSSLLPLALLFFLSTFLSVLPNFLFFMLSVFSVSHTILLLYGGCSQLLNAKESLASLIVPIMVIVSTLLTWVAFSLLF